MRRRSGARALVALALAVAGLVADTQAQQAPTPLAPAPATIEASRLADGETHVIDGVLDEPAWSRAVPAANFMQRDPDTGAPATERTEVRVVVDSTRLILGVTCFDSEPQRLLGNQMQRDQPFSGDDRFMWGSTRTSTAAPGTSSRSTRPVRWATGWSPGPAAAGSSARR